MGSVWVAQQTEPVKRQVAVKLIKAGMDSKQVLAGFERRRPPQLGDTHSSASSSVFGMTTIRTAARSGCQHVKRPFSTHSRSVGKANGSCERRRKQAVKLFILKGTGSM